MLMRQATLAAAVASGRMNSSTSAPPASKVIAPAAPQSSLPAPQMRAPTSTPADVISASQASLTREVTNCTDLAAVLLWAR